MNFGQALELLVAGRKVAREGWNGKGMWLVLVQPDDDLDPPTGPAYTVTALPPFGRPGEMRCLPWIGMKTADNAFVPWLASQTDILAGDWCEAAA